MSVCGRLTLQTEPAILPASPPACPTRVPNILVADDNPVSLRFFAEALAQLGFACELARDGVETVMKAQRSSFDLLLIDARMPGLDGAGALARIRGETGPSRGAPALATTADAGAEAHRTLMAAGFVDVVAKPVTVDTLGSLLARHLGAPARSEDRLAKSDGAIDDVRALAAVGGDASILIALRGLLMSELDALPAEIAAISAREDGAMLRDRLHRLDASAGFCGAPGLSRAAAALRTTLDSAAPWPAAAIAEFIATCADVRAILAKSGVTTAR
jgi:CheY-like chemotaxis protein